MMRVAILSDTHGLLRPELFRHMEGVDRIVHAGDVGSTDILVELGVLAPVTAVWGNTDGFEVRDRTAETAREQWDGHAIVVTHGHTFGTPTPDRLAGAYPDADLVVFGHTHRPLAQRIGRVLTVNPGSLGPRRSNLEPSFAIAELGAGGINVRFIRLRGN